MKNAVTKAEPRMIDIILPGQQMDAAGRINYFHTLSKQAGEVAVKAALYAGMELFKAKVEHPGTFDAWVDQNCSFGRATAYRYLSLLSETVGKGADLVGLAEGTDDARTDAIAEYAGNMESKGLTELYVDLGIVKKSKSNLGGKREGAGRPRKDAAKLAAQEAADNPGFDENAVSGAVSDLYRIGVTEQGFDALGLPALNSVISLLEDVLRTCKEIAKAKKAK